MDTELMMPEDYRPRTPPFRHQIESLKAATVGGRPRPAFAYFLEMGLGKSRVAIDEFCLGYTRGDFDAMLVFAPKPVYSNWTRQDDKNPGELQRWLWDGIREKAVIHKYRAGKTRVDARDRRDVMDVRSPGARILVINIEAVSATIEAEEFARQFLRTHKKVYFVVDESTILKNPKAARTKKSIRLSQLAVCARILTGSPSTGSPSDLFSQFEFLGPGQRLLGHKSFYTFQARYCKLREIVVAGRTIRTEVGAQNIEELADIVSRHSIRRTKDQCLDLPPKNYLPRYEIEMTDEQKQAYDEMKRTSMTIFRGAEVTADIILTQVRRLHQILCGHIRTDDGLVMEIPNNRTKAVADIAERTEQQIVVWTGYRPSAAEVVKALAERYGIERIAQWHGGVPDEERERQEEEFQAGRRRFMVATQHAGARGRTWTAGTLNIYHSNTDSLEQRQQSEDRTHRIGTTGVVSYLDIVIPGTLDEKIIQALRDGNDVARAIVQDGPMRWI